METVLQKEILAAPYPPVFRRQKGTVGRRDTMMWVPQTVKTKLDVFVLGTQEQQIT